jgi:Phosphotransferase enzyme family
VDELAELIVSSHARWMPRVVEAIFGTSDPVSVAAALTEGVVAAVAVPVVAAKFYEPGVGVVVGLGLADGRAVVAKVHRATFMPLERLATIARVQADLVAAGVPAPAPLAGPLVLRNGWLTVEEHRGGDSADGYDPAVRRGMASALHDFVDAARPHAGSGLIGTWLGEPMIDGLWPAPHDLRFDFAGTAAGADWIDDAARAARATLAAMALPDVVGHLDWRVQNLAFAGSRVSAIYDWDSVGLVPEAALVGSGSVIHPVDWRLEQPDPPFDADEREVLSAGQRWVASFGARCQHSDDLLGLFPDVDHSRGWPRLLGELLGR